MLCKYFHNKGLTNKIASISRNKLQLTLSSSSLLFQQFHTYNKKEFGRNVFKGSISAPYLEGRGLSKNILDSVSWTRDISIADQVAGAVSDWARDQGASVYCHWFQPLTSNGVRHGMSGQVQNRMFEFDKEGNMIWSFRGKNLLQGETDGSSFPTGGLRATHRAGGYLGIDPTSPIFIRDDTVFIPSFFISYEGDALDEKTPLIRSLESLSNEGARLLKLLGVSTVDGLHSNIGLEQEFFFVPREAYLRRLDLQLAGRTVIGKDSPRGQEMCDHYMSPPHVNGAPYQCMKKIQEECFKMGISLKTRHREVAPGQYEFAPLYGFVTTQIDQNLMLMQVMEEISLQYGLVCLFTEKPFRGVNGSGKHNNWSIETSDGVNLFDHDQVYERYKNPYIFPIMISAVMKALDEYGDLLRMSISVSGNDFRLGACEAPPSIMSMYLGELLTNYLENLKNGKMALYNPNKYSYHVSNLLPTLQLPEEDRNRTSPFPYVGSRFEFRSVGSSQNPSIVNTVLNTILTNSFHEISNELEKTINNNNDNNQSVNIELFLQNLLSKHWRIIFNGNGYDAECQKQLIEKGLWNIPSTVDGITAISNPKNMEIFQKFQILNEKECIARQNCMLDHYTSIVEIELKCLIEMIQKEILPLKHEVKMSDYKIHFEELENSLHLLENSEKILSEMDNKTEKAKYARYIRFEILTEARKVCDKIEERCPRELWKISTYSELLFIDHMRE